MSGSTCSEILGGRYRPRIVDSRIEYLLSSFGGVRITGPKWCGKTWTGLRHSKSVAFVSDRRVRDRAELDPGSVLKGERPRLIDEWQDAPGLWDAARLDIDMAGERGMYIFTGSSDPRKGSTSHSGTGRFANVLMRPMSLYESGDSSGAISLSGLLEGATVPPTSSEMDYPEIVRLICRGGWPSAIERDAGGLPAQYIGSILDSDVAHEGGRKRLRSTSELIIRSLARSPASSVKASTIGADASGADASEQTVRAHLDAFKRVHLIDEQDAWHPSLRSRSRLRQSPKIHFIDPSLAAAALDAGEEEIASDPNTAGLLFESLCYRDVCVYSSAFGGKVRHFRDSNGFEVDQIVEGGRGRWGAIEVKLGDRDFDKAAKNLLKLRDKMEDGSKPPSFMAILTATGGLAYTRDDGVSVIPIDLLGP